MLLAVFSINDTTGEVQSLVELDREEIDSYLIVVTAQDGGSPPMSTEVMVDITVGDINDNDPYFVGGAVVQNTSVEIYEVNFNLCSK